MSPRRAGGPASGPPARTWTARRTSTPPPVPPCARSGRPARSRAAPRALVTIGRPQRRLDEDVAETQGEAPDRRLGRRRDERGQLENRPLRRRAACQIGGLAPLVAARFRREAPFGTIGRGGRPPLLGFHFFPVGALRRRCAGEEQGQQESPHLVQLSSHVADGQRARSISDHSAKEDKGAYFSRSFCHLEGA